jgi:hypothetical protein
VAKGLQACSLISPPFPNQMFEVFQVSFSCSYRHDIGIMETCDTCNLVSNIRHLQPCEKNATLATLVMTTLATISK